MFDLSGKVAIVTGCNTGLGQGMALALAQAGCDIVGLNIVPADATAAAAKRMGRRFQDIATDLSTAKAEDLIARGRKTSRMRNSAYPHDRRIDPVPAIHTLVTIPSLHRANAGGTGSGL